MTFDRALFMAFDQTSFMTLDQTLFIRLRSCHLALMTFSENSRLELADDRASMKYALNRIVFSFQVFKYQRLRTLDVNLCSMLVILIIQRNRHSA